MNDSKETRFKQIIEENSQRINSICSYYNSNAEDRKDLHQEILVNIWKSLDKFRGDSAISTWIYRIAVNTSLSFNGKAYRHMNLNIESVPQSMNLLLDDEEMEHKVSEEHHFEELEAQLNMLSIIDKALITLVLEGCSMREIADIIGLTEPNVKVKIHRIKEQLKQQFNIVKL
jgi:RNA polymerase sigma-70 factor (ECF subfamily)